MPGSRDVVLAKLSNDGVDSGIRPLRPEFGPYDGVVVVDRGATDRPAQLIVFALFPAAGAAHRYEQTRRVFFDGASRGCGIGKPGEWLNLHLAVSVALRIRHSRG